MITVLATLNKGDHNKITKSTGISFILVIQICCCRQNDEAYIHFKGKADMVAHFLNLSTWENEGIFHLL